VTRRTFLLFLLTGILQVGCSEIRHYDQPLDGPNELVIYSTTDTGAFEPVIADFNRLFPSVKVKYVEMEAIPLYQRFLQEEQAHGRSADLLLSSAMDLQVKLVNDGFAAPHISANARELPRWANWRNEAFGVTFEPVVMAFNRKRMIGREIPSSRAELLQALRVDREFWRNRIGTYDVAKSGVGYLIASQDARNGDDSGALVEAMREAAVVKAATTSEILDDLESGRISAGYNLLGSYASARAETSPDIVIVYPKDYTLAVSRTAIIPKTAPNSNVSHVFLDYLLSMRAQLILTEESRLDAVRVQVSRHIGDVIRAGDGDDQLRPISLGPGLLVYLDRLKRQRFLQLWDAPFEPHQEVYPPRAP
jgi:ABC-type Fe3+ transport system substrate-binding protein